MAISIRNEISAAVRLRSRIAKKVGAEINVGERFTIAFTVTNEAEYGDNIVFTAMTLNLQQTQWAIPIDSGGVAVPFVELSWAGRLDAGGSVDFELEFEALAGQESAIRWRGLASSTYNPEEFIRYKVFVTVDPVKLLSDVLRTGVSSFQVGARNYYCSNPEVTHEHSTWRNYCLESIETPGAGSRLCGYPIPN